MHPDLSRRLASNVGESNRDVFQHFQEAVNGLPIALMNKDADLGDERISSSELSQSKYGNRKLADADDPDPELRDGDESHGKLTDGDYPFGNNRDSVWAVFERDMKQW